MSRCREERNNALNTQAKVTRLISYCSPAAILIWNLVIVAALLATFKFGANADVTFPATFAVVMYAGLPMALPSILVIMALFAELNPDSFTLQDPAATNLGFLLNQADSLFLYTVASALDTFMIWTLFLTALGISCFARNVSCPPL